MYSLSPGNPGDDRWGRLWVSRVEIKRGVNGYVFMPVEFCLMNIFATDVSRKTGEKQADG